jgi:hypothetical protein
MLGGEHEERRQEREAALHLVRLHRLLADEAGEEVAPRLERRAEVVPVARERVRLDPGELEVVDPAEESQGHVPAELSDQFVHERLARAAAREARVHGRALRLELRGLPAEDPAAIA